MPLGGSPKSRRPPPLPPPVKTIDTGAAGKDESGRLRGRSRGQSIIAGRGQLQSATVRRRELKQKLGATV
jgi:hypothetical protein